MPGVIQGAARAAVEGFMDSGNVTQRREAYAGLATMLLAFIISLVILGFIGKYLWNGVVVDLFSIAKPAKSIWQIIGLMILLSLLLP